MATPRRTETRPILGAHRLPPALAEGFAAYALARGGQPQAPTQLALGLDPAETQTLELRCDLLEELLDKLSRKQITRTTDIARVLGVTKSRASDLVNRRYDRFRLDMLALFAARAGLAVSLRVRQAA